MRNGWLAAIVTTAILALALPGHARPFERSSSPTEHGVSSVADARPAQVRSETDRPPAAVIDFDLAPPIPRLAPTPSPTPRLTFDLSLTVTGLLVGLAPSVSKGPWGPSMDLRGLHAGGLNALDRSVVGNHSHAAEITSDVLLTANMVAPHVILAIGQLVDEEGSLGKLTRDSLILTETLAATWLTVNLVKFAVRRPRPYTYSLSADALEHEETEASLSFFSGHTALSFAMATSFSYLFTKRHPDSPLVVPIWIGSHALAATTAVMRVQAGKHFWTDVLVGAAVGSAIGYLVPALHGDGSTSGVLANLRVVPQFYSGGMGASALYTW